MRTVLRTLFFTVVMVFGIAPIDLLAQEQESREWKISGFGLWMQEFPRGRSSSLKLNHAWLIGEKSLDSNLSIKVIAALQGPPKIAHVLFLKWKKPLEFIDYVRIGRFDAPFGHGLCWYRIDRNPTINYSLIDEPVVLMSNGVEVVGALNNLEWKVAAFSGDRLLGTVSAADEGKWDIYFPRVRYAVNNFLSIGVSQRFGPVSARGVDVVGELGPLYAEAESVTSKDTTGYSVLGVCTFSSWLKAVLRYERFHGKDQWTPGFTIPLPYNAEIKGNAIIGHEKKLETFLVQLVLRW